MDSVLYSTLQLSLIMKQLKFELQGIASEAIVSPIKVTPKFQNQTEKFNFVLTQKLR